MPCVIGKSEVMGVGNGEMMYFTHISICEYEMQPEWRSGHREILITSSAEGAKLISLYLFNRLLLLGLAV